jgi:general secretion pathway protein E
MLTLPVFSQLLEPAGLAPAMDFASTNILVYREPPSLELAARLRFVMGSNLQLREGEAEEIARLLRHWRAELSPDFSADDDNNSSYNLEDDLNDLDSEAPIIRLVNHLFARALDLNASDIHFEPGESHLIVRCRVDGIMTQIEKVPARVQGAVASRLKLMARMDIGEKRLPQDGRIDYRLGSRDLDMRVSTLPGVLGESIVLRILDRRDLSIDLEELGMPTSVLEAYSRVISQPHGLILITGPTGSGKTTTLYATLEKIHDRTRKIVTVEDPVEYQLDGITQVQVNSQIGLSFARGLRSIVRQDPDILMIGEIRDHETAEIAIESALTGHLVFSTLHTNDAAGAVIRLQDMGVESYLISSSLLGIQAQRLVRRVCEGCAYTRSLTTDEATVLAVDVNDYQTVREGCGCERCGGTGYRGRIGLYELLLLSDEIKHLITQEAPAAELRKQGQKQGMRTLREDALTKLRIGLTTPAEVVRVT